MPSVNNTSIDPLHTPSLTSNVNTQYILTLNLPTTTIVAQPFNVIKWQLKFNPVA